MKKPTAILAVALFAIPGCVGVARSDNLAIGIAVGAAIASGNQEELESCQKELSELKKKYDVLVRLISEDRIREAKIMLGFIREAPIAFSRTYSAYPPLCPPFVKKVGK